MIKQAILISVVIFLVLLIASGALINYHFSLDDFSQFEQLITQSGALGPFLIILLQALQVILIPIPGQATGLISGFFFGPFLGTFYSMVGLTIGSFVAFYISRMLGRPFVKKIIPRETMDRFEHISDSKKISLIFLVFLIPMFPDDAVCFISGLTKIKLRTLVIIAILGRLPGTFIANVIGNGVAISKFETTIVFITSILIFLIFMHRFRNKIENKLNLYLKQYAKRRKRS